jgi:broad specificity phosphatase PhoE
MTVILFLRHAHSEANGAGILAGQISGIHLSNIGRKQAKTFARNYADMYFSEIHISPLERCRETISPYLDHVKKNSKKKISVIENRDFIEMDYGSWSGMKLRKLALLPLWRRIQKNPSTVTFPEGESFIALNKRVHKGLLTIARKNPRGQVLVVTHADVIKLALANALKMELNDFQKIAIDPASVSAIEINGNAFRVLTMNSKPEPFIVGGNRFLLGGGAGAKARKV